jgi:hypothetical protein
MIPITGLQKADRPRPTFKIPLSLFKIGFSNCPCITKSQWIPMNRFERSPNTDYLPAFAGCDVPRKIRPPAGEEGWARGSVEIRMWAYGW